MMALVLSKTYPTVWSGNRWRSCSPLQWHRSRRRGVFAGTWEIWGQEHVKKLILPNSCKLFSDRKCMAKCQSALKRDSNRKVFLGMSSAPSESRFFHVFQTGRSPDLRTLHHRTAQIGPPEGGPCAFKPRA